MKREHASKQVFSGSRGVGRICATFPRLIFGEGALQSGKTACWSDTCCSPHQSLQLFVVLKYRRFLIAFKMELHEFLMPLALILEDGRTPGVRLWNGVRGLACSSGLRVCPHPRDCEASEAPYQTPVWSFQGRGSGPTRPWFPLEKDKPGIQPVSAPQRGQHFPAHHHKRKMRNRVCRGPCILAEMGVPDVGMKTWAAKNRPCK